MDQEHLHVRFFQEFLTPPNPESAAKWLSQHLSPRIKSSAVQGCSYTRHSPPFTLTVFLNLWEQEEKFLVFEAHCTLHPSGILLCKSFKLWL